MTTTFIIFNAVLSLAVLAAVGGLTRVAHRLPRLSPLSDEQWGRGGDPFVPSEPLPLHQVALHEDERAEAIAA